MEATTIEQSAQTADQTIIPPAAQDFFANLELLRVAPESNESTVVRRILNLVPVRKPAKECFFRIHPDYALEALILEVKEDQETLLVSPALKSALEDEKCVARRILRLGINRQGNPFIWPVRPPMEGRRDGWAMTSLDAFNRAETQWVRMQADMNLGGYKLALAKIDDEPVWPEQSFGELVRIAFHNAVVDSLDHPTLKRLRGEL